MAEDNTNELMSPVTSVKSDSAGSKSDKASASKPRSLSNGRSVLPCYRNSSNSSHNGGNARRQSTGKLGTPDSGQDTLPHYLRASTGSCHDFCKYGRKHAFEEKPWHSLSKRKNKLPDDDHSPTWTMVGEAKKGIAVKQKPSTTARLMLGDETKVTRVEKKLYSSPGTMQGETEKETVVKQNPLTASGSALGKTKKGSVIKQKPCTPPRSMLEQGKKVNMVNQKTSSPHDGVLGEGKKVAVVEQTPSSPPGSMLGEGDDVNVMNKKPSCPPGSTLGEGDEITPICQKPSTTSENMLGEEKKVPVVDQMPSTPAESTLAEEEKATVVEPKPSTSPKTRSLEPSVCVDSLELYSSSDKIPNTEKKMKNVVAKHSPLGQKKLKTMKMNSSSKTLGGADGGRKDNDVNLRKRIIVSKVSAEKSLKTPTVSRSPRSTSVKPLLLRARSNKSLKVLAPLKDQNKIRRDGTNKLNPDRVPVKGEPNSLEPAQDGNINPRIRPPSISSQKSSSQSQSRLSSSGEKKKGRAADISTSSKMTLKKGKGGLSDDCNSSAVKLKFRRGKVVDLQQETSSPRRLTFRWGRRTGESQDSKGDVRRRILKKKGVDGDNSSSMLNSGKIVLRHQDVQQKKDAQVLLNNVIEETASKLVESKKSKVKALVGAFETVISLQDKPSTVTVS